MRVFVFLLVVVMAACQVTEGKDKCSVLPTVEETDKDFKSMTTPCVEKMEAQVNMELQAALTYMAMGAHFSEDSVNRPGFAKMFFESASEEREHAFKIVDYLLMRGRGESGLEKLIKEDLTPETVTWDSPLAAMKAALALEIKVTESITGIVTACENAVPATEDSALFKNDFHLVDYLTGVFLEEQLHGQRDLAGKISTLGKMMVDQGALAEFLFDKKLLSGEPL